MPVGSGIESRTFLFMFALFLQGIWLWREGATKFNRPRFEQTVTSARVVSMSYIFFPRTIPKRCLSFGNGTAAREKFDRCKVFGVSAIRKRCFFPLQQGLVWPA